MSGQTLRIVGRGTKVSKLGPVHTHTPASPPTNLQFRYQHKLLAANLGVTQIQSVSISQFQIQCCRPIHACSLLHEDTQYDLKHKRSGGLFSIYREKKKSFKMVCESYIPPFTLKQKKERKCPPMSERIEKRQIKLLQGIKSRDQFMGEQINSFFICQTKSWTEVGGTQRKLYGLL